MFEKLKEFWGKRALRMSAADYIFGGSYTGSQQVEYQKRYEKRIRTWLNSLPKEQRPHVR